MVRTQIRSEVIIDALRLACRAPSLHNTQPWHWIITNHTVELFADSTRWATSADTTGRQALISCGAVLHHFRVAMAAAGWLTSVQRFPDPDAHLHLASITLAPSPSISEEQKRRADAILSRRTDRLPLAEPPDWPELAAGLTALGRPGMVRLDVVDERMRSALAEASQLTDALRLLDSRYHSELAWWTQHFTSHQGIPPSSLISAPESDRVDIGRTFPVSTHPERRTELVDDRSRILVLSTDDDSRENVLRCGEVLSAVLLDATTAGLATCTLTH